MKIRSLIMLALLTFLCSATWASEATTPRVVVSIKPIHSLVVGVMQGIAEPSLLVKGGGSPHGYVLRPSEVRSIANADLIIWVGHQLEPFLEKPLATLGKNALSLELLEMMQAHLLPVRAGGSWDAHLDAGDDHGHEETVFDPHLWLSPRLAREIVDQIAAALGEVDPARKIRYRQNAEALQQQLITLEEELQRKLAGVKEVPYVVFHDAYRYFEVAFGLNPVGSITVDPERKPGVRRVLEMRNKIKELSARAVFSEPQFEPRLVATIIEGSGAKTGELDPLGAELEVGPQSYFLLIEGLAENLLKGLN